jgi:hypothetical protein
MGFLIRCEGWRLQGIPTKRKWEPLQGKTISNLNFRDDLGMVGSDRSALLQQCLIEYENTTVKSKVQHPNAVLILVADTYSKS